ncbi:hypothetical protein [Leuconostoc gasicomitatum]|uniref:hypothetical protein n=1 Tax=Leuconostoc gasicomitatum TaxID=115778 RepID=UPI001CC5FDFB|nr:hypothetical protein [Leuconostoc gasicomitatum]
MHNRLMFYKKLNDGMNSFVKGTRKAVKGVIDGIRNMISGNASTEHEEAPEIKDIYSEMHKPSAPEGLMQIVPPSLTSDFFGS